AAPLRRLSLPVAGAGGVVEGGRVRRRLPLLLRPGERPRRHAARGPDDDGRARRRPRAAGLRLVPPALRTDRRRPPGGTLRLLPDALAPCPSHPGARGGG